MRFSIIPAGFGCEVVMDAWVGGWRWGAPLTDSVLEKRNIKDDDKIIIDLLK